MANKILVARGTKARIEEIKSTLTVNELVYSTDTGELGVKKANGNIEYFMNATDIGAIVDDKVDKVSGKGLSTNDFTNNDKNKLDGIEAGAEVNTVDSVNGQTGVVVLDAEDVGALPDDTPLFSGDYDDLSNKPYIPTKVSDLTNDTGYITGYTETDPIFTAWDKSTGISITKSQVSDFAHNHDDRYYTEAEINTLLNAKLNSSLKGSVNGLAELGADGKVPSSQLPSYVDDVLEYTSFSNFPLTGESSKIYISQDTNKTYRWGGSGYIEISASLALGETSSTAGRGDWTKTAYDHTLLTNNPHGVTATQIGAEPAFSKNTAFNKNFGTTAGTVAQGNHLHTGVYEPANSNIQSHIDSTSNPHGVTKTQVGLGNVDNTSDLNKPISTATQSALNNKVDKVAGKGLSTEDYTTTEKTKLSGIEAGAQVNTVTSVAGKTGAVVLAKADVGLGSVQNYAVASKTEAEAGTSNTLYMTPLRTKELITVVMGDIESALDAILGV
jgi:Cu/Ag efflux protein CusF